MAKKVLVVDDEKLIVKGIRFSLEQDGMEVDCAYDGEEAIEAAKKKNMMWFFWILCYQSYQALRYASKSESFHLCLLLC